MPPMPFSNPSTDYLANQARMMQRDPHDPRTPMLPMDEQVTQAIAKGFTTVLTDSRAQQTEMISVWKDAARELSQVAAAISGNTSGRLAVNSFAQDVQVHGGGEHRGSKASTAARTPEGRFAAPSLTPAEMAAVSTRASGKAHAMMQDLIADASRHDVPVMTAGDVFGRLDHPDAEMEQLSRKDVFVGNSYRISPEKTREQLRHRANEAVLRRAETWAYRGVDLQGGGIARIGDKLMKVAPGVHHVDQGGVARDEAGNALSGALTELGGGEAASITRRLAMARTLTDVSGAVAEGAPVGQALVGMIPGGLATLGTAAVAVEGLKKGAEFVQGQMAKSRGIQEYYGGSFGESVGERANQWVNRNITGMFSSLGPEAYDELFKGAMHMGLRGDRRSSYISTGADIMGQGVSADQTQDIMRTALTTGQGLQGLAKAIREVDTAARDAGVSAKDARDAFMKNYEASSDILFGSPGAAKQIAAATTAYGVSFGQSYMGVDFTGQFSENQQYANAARVGLSPTQYNQQVRRDPTVNTAISESAMKDRLMNLTSETGQTFQQVVQAFIDERLAENRPYNASFEQDNVELGEQLNDAGFRPDVVASILRSGGITVTKNDQALGIAGRMFTTQNQTNAAIGNQRDRTAALTRGTAIDNSYGKSGSGSDPWNQALQASVGIGINSSGDSTGAKVAPFPVLTELAAQHNALDINAMGTDVEVETKNGRMVVPLSVAMSMFPDQLQNGSATFMNGKQKGQTVKSVLGIPDSVSAATPTSSNATALPDAFLHAGTAPGGRAATTLEDYLKRQEAADKKKASESGGESKVTIDLDPSIKQYFIATAQRAGGTDPYAMGSG